MSQSGTFRAIATGGRIVAQTFIGILFIAGGGYIAYRALQHEPHDTKVLYLGAASALFGALIFPSIFPMFQRIYVVVFPNGLPLIGGKRASDPPAGGPNAAP